MSRCPRCGEAGTISINRVLASKPAGTFSVAGVQPKVVAAEKYELTCSHCRLYVRGHLKNATTDPATNTFTSGYFVADDPISLG
jgi:hypothetical protein